MPLSLTIGGYTPKGSHLLLASLLIYILLKLASFLRLYINARRSGFPIYVVPVPSTSPVWMIMAPIFNSTFQKYLPECIFERLDVATHGWEYRRKGEIHRRLGGVFALVTLDECSLWVADPAMGNVVMQRRKEFLQAPIVGKVMGIFGSNILLADGDDWQRQRRIVAPNLNEKISQTVFTESCHQAQEMIAYLLRHPGNETLNGLRSVAINVIGSAGYGQTQPWSPKFHNFAEGWDDARSAYFKTIALVVDALMEAAFLPTALLKRSFMPEKLQLLGTHRPLMPEYTRQLLDRERQTAKDGSETRSNLLSMLVRFSDAANRGAGPSLTDDEISGNLFVFSTAGFDTTANTMGYAVMAMAARPEWQEWVREELRDLDQDISGWRYEEVFPRCTRTLALMFEVLRIFSPIAHSTRHVAEPQQLDDGTKAHLLLPPMDVYVSIQTLHLEPAIWGQDAMEFRPSRWVDSEGGLITPVKGTFVPWSSGPRICPGMKMAQVEFVSTIATLFRSTRCEPLRMGEETMEESCRRLWSLMEDSTPRVTLQVNNPTQVKLRWIEDNLG